MEKTFTVKSVDEIKPIFRDNDNTKNIFLMSSIPFCCKTEPCILGIDEAGRGPVLGPMNYGICFCPKSKEEVLKTLGCADSKSLTDEKRQVILGKMCEETETLGWMVEAISPNNICRNMFRRQKYSLNQVSHDSAIGLIKKAQAHGVNVCEVFVDTVGPPEKYQEKLSWLFPELKITVSKKADSLYPIVSAASIAAKVTRDFAIEVWNFTEELSSEKKYGSGYPNDPETKKFLQTNIDPVFGFPKLVRFSWSTAEKILVSSAVPVQWEEEEDEASGKPLKNKSITSFFSPGAKKAKRSRHAFFQQSKLSVTDCFKIS
ncbi:unnamed protein product [Bemisia tabaci]|uniref:Ribonuclease n=1 Tax=Bemisia tabaci TaxID=7038 RepID=A0A9P0AH40_BEMTA|nr:unnamed protein product [Bemisia tabaci]